MKLNFRPLKSDDIENLILPMTRAFNDDSKQFNGQEKGGPPGYDDGSFLKKYAISDQNSTAYKILNIEEPIGAFIIWWDRNGESFLGNIFIDPKFQNQGIGQKVWTFIETTFPTKSWKLETPVWSVRNHAFYKKCGFKEIGSNEHDVFFEKVYK